MPKPEKKKQDPFIRVGDKLRISQEVKRGEIYQLPFATNRGSIRNLTTIAEETVISRAMEQAKMTAFSTDKLWKHLSSLQESGDLTPAAVKENVEMYNHLRSKTGSPTIAPGSYREYLTVEGNIRITMQPDGSLKIS